MKIEVAAICLAATMALSTVMAQPAPGRRPHPPNAEGALQRLTTLLDLTAAQQAEAKTIFADEATATQDLRPKLREAHDAFENAVKNTGLDADIERAAAQLAAVQTQLMSAQGKAQAKFRSILTSEQKQKLDSARGMGPRRGEPGMRERFGQR